MDNYCKHVGNWSTARRNFLAFGAFVCKHGIAFTSYLRYGFCLFLCRNLGRLERYGSKEQQGSEQQSEPAGYASEEQAV